MIARGHDVKITIMRGGAVVSVFDLVSADIDFGVETETVDYVGDAAPRVFGINKEARLTLSGEPTSTAFGALIAAVRDANKPNSSRVPVRIDASVSVDFGDGGRDRWKFPDCKLSSPKLNTSGRTDRVKSNLDLICANPSRM